MAESWEFSADCLELDLQAAPGREVARRPPFTAEDVRVHVRGDDPPEDADGVSSERFLQVKDVQAPIPTRCGSPTTSRTPAALETWGMNMLPKHLLRGVSWRPAS